jgi:transcriptional regulator with XRE-family HTH domain
MDAQPAAEIEREYLLDLGRQLRAARRQLGLSLKLVEARTGGEFKASALGAYERAQRTISVPRLHRLAHVYGTTVDRLLPTDQAVIDLRDSAIEPARSLT